MTGWGSLITVSVNFLLNAFILFPIIRALSMLRRAEPPVPPRSEVLLEEIKDALVVRGTDPVIAQRAESLLGEIRDFLANK